jgi:hypothetical protein
MNKHYQITAIAAAILSIGLLLPLLTGCGQSGTGSKQVEIEFSMDVDRDVYKYSNYGEPPQLAIWLEQPETGKIRTVWVARRSGRRLWKGKVECPTALPYWESRHNKEKSAYRQRGLLERLVDAISGATPKGGTFKARVELPLGSKWEYYIEMNVSGDYNYDFPSCLEDGTPDPEGNGQPSLIYKGIIKATPGNSCIPELIGRTDQWIAVDHIIEDLKGITNAKKVLSNINVSCTNE